jgi:hypothetical protein
MKIVLFPIKFLKSTNAIIVYIVITKNEKEKVEIMGLRKSKSEIYGFNVFDLTIRLNKFSAAAMKVYGSKCPYQLENGGNPGSSGYGGGKLIVTSTMTCREGSLSAA